jgi:hypothetical protein
MPVLVNIVMNRIQSQKTSNEIRGDRSGTGAGLSPSFSVTSC